ncbi:restriction endonuclease subunit S [Vibrio cholerae]|uniref:restriction endonuclease subunit S n=1 Tax=Vibrio cholerae TaxID=666 RepID=UPI002934C827|nr:restriction endonuclease subunit S [Vibrio cholerae]MDV2301175.1 restriction endonuclease subunit S [Vibrio cholerae]
MVPKGWDALNLKNVAQKIQDGNYGADYPKADELVASGIPFLTSKVIGGNGTVNQDKFDYISEEKHQKLKKAQITSGDILFTNRGANVGTIAITPDYLSDGNIGPQLTLIRCNEKIEKDFLFQFLRGSFFQKQVCQQDSGSAMNFFGIKDTERFKILVPPLPEQKKIAKILSTWDKAITTTEQLLANSQQQKKALMQQLLTGRKRLLDKNGVSFSGEWRVSKLSKLFERVTTKNNGQSTNVVTISGQHGLIRQEEFFKKAVASETLDGYFLLRQGQFAYNKSYSNGYPMGAIKRLNRYPDGVVTTLYICFELSDSGRADSDFWEHYFESGLLNKGLSQIAHEGGRAHGLLNVKPSDFFSLKVSTPSFEEQQKIAAVLSTADQEISALQQKLDALKQEKKALMQQLLTGKRRVLV